MTLQMQRKPDFRDVDGKEVILPGINPGDLFAFLGGACDPTSWRWIVIAYLESLGIKYSNPQVPNGEYDDAIHPAIERVAKREAHLQFFVIEQTRGLVSVLEAIALILKRKNMILVIQPLREGLKIGKPGEEQEVEGVELTKIDYARQYLADLAAKFDVPVYVDVETAMKAIPGAMSNKAERSTKRVTQTLGIKLSSMLDEELVYDLGIDPYDIETLLTCMTKAYAIAGTGTKKVKLTISNNEFLFGQTFRGLKYDGDRFKDWNRLRKPYMKHTLEDAGCEVIMLPA